MPRYYISFAYQNDQGFGMAGVDFNFKWRIAAMEELACVHEELARQGYHNITILGFSLYADTTDTAAARPHNTPAPRPQQPPHRRPSPRPGRHT
ncbi:hypothetical protein [Actinoplanes sp. NPDC049599]|uniref:hypothetical protein n=1 Tax=Actinoplanes sp. NPDC049599 TaxID=3363903 RepID=UPI00379105EA